MTTSADQTRVAVIGNSVYFENHYPERWENDPNIRVFDANENDSRFLLAAANFRPHLTVFFRPELYPRPLIQHIPGRKIALLSEPVPKLHNGAFLESIETRTRLAVYSTMSWDSFDSIYYYDRGKKETIERLGWRIDDYRQLPINTSVFLPTSKQRPIDVCFVGKPTARRIRILDTLRYAKFKFVWVAHGVSGAHLAKLFRRSKSVINVHADDLPAFEPRVVLAAACGCAVITEDLGYYPDDLADRIVVFKGQLDWSIVEAAIRLHEGKISQWQEQGPLKHYSMRIFLSEHLKARS